MSAKPVSMAAGALSRIWLLVVVTGVLCTAGCGSSHGVPGAQRSPSAPTLSVPAVLARTLRSGAAHVQVTLYNPGLASQGLTPIYSGSFDLSTSKGSLSLALPGLAPAVMVLAPSEAFLSTSFLPAALARPGEPSFLAMPYGEASNVAASSPGAMLQAVLANPSLWLRELRGATAVMGSGRSEVISGGVRTDAYKVVIDLAKAADLAGGGQRAALGWLARFFGVDRLPAEVWVGMHGRLRQLRLWRLAVPAEPPATGRGWRFPAAGISEPAVTYVLSLGGFSKSPAAVPPVSGTVSNLGTAAPANCRPAGSTGLTAEVVASSGQRITGPLDAAGCGVGVYVPPGSSGVVVDRAVITGASDHAVFAEDATHVVIEHSTVSLTPGAGSILDHMLIPEDKAIVLAGTSFSVVRDNIVTGKVDGGIAVTDDGVVDPAAFNPGRLHAATGNLITGNQVHNGSGGCGIVLSSFDVGGGVTHDTVSGNSVVNSHPGGIVLAADAPGASTSDNLIEGNTVVGSLIPGIILHGNAPRDSLSANCLLRNIISQDGADGLQGLTQHTGIALIGDFAPIQATVVSGNTISQEAIGVWMARSDGTRLYGNTIGVGPDGSAISRVARPSSVSELRSFDRRLAMGRAGDTAEAA